jgi:hypothetical protein
MVKMNIDQNTTFTQISAQMNTMTFNQEIRGETENNVQRLYNHNPLKPHGIGTEAKQERTAKEQQGATWIRNAIDVQYGQGMGARVFRHVNNNAHVNLTNRVMRDDLATIQTSIATLQNADNQAVTSIALYGQPPLTQTKAQALLATARDPNVSPQHRDQAANALHTNMMQLNGAARGQILTNAGGQPNTIFANALATLQASNGQNVFSVAETAALTVDMHGRAPLTQDKAEALLAVATNPNVPNNTKDQAANALHTNMMALNPAVRAQVLTKANSSLPHDALTSAIFTLQLSNGQRAFPAADLATIAQDEFRRTAHQEQGESFFRGASLASRLMSNGLSNLGNGYLPALGNAILQDVQAQMLHPAMPTTILAANGQPVANPAFVNLMLQRADGVLQQNVLPGMPAELTTFLTAIRNGVNNGNPPNNPQTQQPWTGTGFLMNVVVLRCINPILTVGSAPGAERQVMTSLSVGMQQVANFNAPFGNQSNYVGLNPGVNTLLAANSGYSALMAQVP